MTNLKKILVAAAAIVLAALSLAACSSGGNGGGQQKESHTQQSNYDRLVAQEPAHTMSYSSTRKTINFWIDTWGKPGKIAYVYLQNANGDLTGFYTLVGPPVSMCTSLTPNYKLLDEGGGDSSSQLAVPAPSIDGVFYSGGECNTYYGEDATTHAYVQFSVGLGQNVLLYDQPLTNHPNVVNLAPGKYDQTKHK